MREEADLRRISGSGARFFSPKGILLGAYAIGGQAGEVASRPLREQFRHVACGVLAITSRPITPHSEVNPSNRQTINRLLQQNLTLTDKGRRPMNCRRPPNLSKDKTVS